MSQPSVTWLNGEYKETGKTGKTTEDFRNILDSPN